MSHEADSGWGSIDAGRDRPVLRSDREFDTILARDALSRRALLARAAGLGVATVGLPAFLARGAAAKDLLVRATPRRGGTLVFAWIYPPVPQMDPQLPTNATVGDVDAFLLIYDQLTNIIPHTLKNGPGLAESWEATQGGRVYTFHLRDAEFSNGDKVTAKDVKFSFERFANPKINSQYGFLSAIDRVQALDNKTVRITLKYIQAMFPDVVGHGAASIVPQRVVEARGKKFAQQPVGSGAFMFDSKRPGASITFKRNPNYWKTGKPYLDGLRFDYVPDGTARVLRVTSGQAHAAYVPYALIDQYRSHPGTRLQFERTTNVIFVVPNIKQHPYGDRNVRLALNYATPREAINKAVFKGTARLANSVIGQLQYWDPSVPAIPYDLNKAKQYLKKSAVPSGFQTTLLIDGTDSDSKQIGTILQNAWSQIGIHAKIEQSDLNTMLTRGYKFDYEILFLPPDYSSSDVGADDELAEFFYDPLAVNFGLYAYKDPKATALTNKATHTLNENVRKRTFTELQRYTTQVNPPIVPIAFGPGRTLVSSKVNGLVTLLNYSYRMENVWLTA